MAHAASAWSGSYVSVKPMTAAVVSLQIRGGTIVQGSLWNIDGLSCEPEPDTEVFELQPR